MNFNQFNLIAEGKKKELIAAYLAGRQQSTPKIVDYGGGEPNSPERAEAIKRMMKDGIGGGAVRRAQKKKVKEAKKAIKQIKK